MKIKSMCSTQIWIRPAIVGARRVKNPHGALRAGARLAVQFLALCLIRCLQFEVVYAPSSALPIRDSARSLCFICKAISLPLGLILPQVFRRMLTILSSL